ncbi:hypothetical protein VW35_16600 [Devosia soli]|uniref:Acyltransferase 3 domain-containing protein n=1 Tax=Devosia soli TaxID=361041 RepID=A0A0F5L2U5_9HYPH|nr:hypothetical protein VW35_16600 [Devosia soli]
MEYNSIQYLRAVAALSVVADHLSIQFSRIGSPIGFTDLLAAGVDLFFVISGFIMFVTTKDSDVTPVQFYKKRIVRIVPLYWFFTSIMVVAALAAPRLLGSGKFDLAHIVSSYLFLPYPHPVVDAIYPVLVPGWTLNYEMYFYAIFGMALLLPAKARLWSVGAVLVSLSALGGLFSPNNAALEFWTDAIILEFLFGMIIAAALTNDRIRLSRAPAWGLIALGVLMLFIPYSASVGLSRAWFFGVPTALVLAGFVMLDRLGDIGRWRVPKLLGDASYSIYLSHGMTLSALTQVWKKLDLGGDLPAIAFFVTIGMAASTCIGIAVYFTIERPMTRLFAGTRRIRPVHA